MPNPTFWSGKRVFLTGHTGFKGAWLSLWLERLGAVVTGFGLEPNTEPSLYNLLRSNLSADSVIGDIADLPALRETTARIDPHIAIHMAAQPLVRRSYREPIETFATNVMGTAHVLDALRDGPSLQAILVVTTDKVYRNLEDGRAFEESDALGAHDPYSASKAATEIVASSWGQSFFAPRGVSLVTARAGNVIGGGDWAEDRIVPDIWRAIRSGMPVVLRHPQAIRPWQHVLEPLDGYLRHVEHCVAGSAPSALNFGPVPSDVLTVGELTNEMLRALKSNVGWKHIEQAGSPEMMLLSLNPALARSIGWEPRLTSRQAVEWTAEWYGNFAHRGDAYAISNAQIARYEALSSARA